MIVLRVWSGKYKVIRRQKATTQKGKVKPMFDWEREWWPSGEKPKKSNTWKDALRSYRVEIVMTILLAMLILVVV